MAYNRTQVERAVDELQRTLDMDRKGRNIQQQNKIVIDDNEDFTITDPQAVIDYLAELKLRRDTLAAQVQAVVATWTF